MDKRKNHGKIPWSKLHNIGSQISASWPEINAIILRYQPKVFSIIRDERETFKYVSSPASARDALLRLSPCYWIYPIPLNAVFRYPQLPWLDGRWVQSSRTHSPWHIWFTITSNSGFMRSSCSPQSELGELLMRLAPPYGLATHCNSHCNMCVAQDIKGPCWFDVIPIFLPAERGGLLWHV